MARDNVLYLEFSKDFTFLCSANFSALTVTLAGAEYLYNY